MRGVREVRACVSSVNVLSEKSQESLIGLIAIRENYDSDRSHLRPSDAETRSASEERYAGDQNVL